MNQELLHTELQQLRLKIQTLEQNLHKSIGLLAQIAQDVGNKEFYSIQEFSSKTGLKAGTLKNYCLNGKLKATQVDNKGKWMIHKNELDRLRKEAFSNHFNENHNDTRRNNLITKGKNRT